ncbi:MAG: flagellar basal body protein FliL [Rhodospirillaceae bacterium]|jgi:flagellar protein FliL|nr:flagellar basal body protein FliL [Rhodospirillaceae bacterium]MBT4490129.1 flagellar basal body protein FliL [Rhodospirillaceae bacterium]MBT5049653.1 flagellar basal body protein FliL [Rhodospirillaceae bacterium]MBT6426517.1 flagellar basal body protein FliL [Rhodospirillaceae bacterium]
MSDADVAETEDVDGAEAEEGGGGGKKKMSGKKMVLFMVLPLLLLLIGGGAGAYFFLAGGDETGGEHGEASADGEGGHGEEGKEGGGGQVVFYDLPEMLVNLNSGGKRASYLKITVALELEDATAVPKLEIILPRVVHNFQVYLRELRLEDLKGSAGLLRLKEELLIRVQRAAGVIKVNDVLFKEMLVQ